MLCPQHQSEIGMSINKQIYVPYSGRRYTVNQYGELLDYRNQLVPVIRKEKEILVDIEWIYGKQLYSLAVIVICSTRYIHIPEHLWLSLIPLYRDNDSSNLFPQNLLYRLNPDGVETEEYPGFYYIPQYSRYAISKNGEVINHTTGKRKICNFNFSISEMYRQKYLGTRCYNDYNISRIAYVHRLLCLTFKEYDGTVDKLVVNHKNGITLDNSFDNLEFCTYTENSQHAYDTGLKLSSTTPMSVINVETGDVKEFISVNHCARFYKVSPSVIHYRIRKGPILMPGGEKLWFKKNTDHRLASHSLENLTVYGSHLVQSVIAKNVFTGESYIFSNLRQCARELNLKHDSIRGHVKKQSMRPYYGYLFRILQSNIYWPTYTKYQLAIYRNHPSHPPCGFLVKNTQTNEETFYDCWQKVNEVYFLSRLQIFSLAKNKKLYKDIYLFHLVC